MMSAMMGRAMTWFARLPRLVGTLSAACGLVATAIPFCQLAGVGSPAIASAADAPMTLIAQELALEQDAPLIITFIPPKPLSSTDTITVGAYRRINSREELTSAIDGEFGRVVDSVRIDPTDPAAFTVDAEGRVTIAVASESINGTPAALQFARRGLYPVTVDVHDAGGSLVGELLTFVDRLPDVTDQAAQAEDEGSLAVAVVASITAPPAIPGADTPLPPEVIDQIADLAQYPTSVPLSVSISPEVLGRLDSETLDALRAVMTRSVVIAQPSIPLDPSAAAAAGQQDLFTELLRAGEDETLARSSVRPARSAWIESAPLTTDGAAMLRDLGIGLVLISPETYADVGIDGGYLRDFTIYSQLRNTQLPDGSSITTAVFDPTIHRNLVDEALSPELAALYTAADLVAWRNQLYASLPPVTGHSVLLGRPGGGVLDRERIARLAEMVTATGAVTFTDLTDYARTTNVQIVDGTDATITLAPQQSPDLTVRSQLLTDLATRRETVSGMLVADAGRTDRWVSTIATLASSALADDQVNEAAALLVAEFDAITSAVVVPASYTFTMNGRSTTLHPRITNTSNEPLHVVIQMRASADKMEFPDGDLAIVLQRGITRVPIPVRARSNGSFTVTLQVMAPDGTTPLTSRTVLKAQVNALTGLAQVFTGGALLILVTWWVRNLRRSRHQHRAVSAMSGHPASARTTDDSAGQPTAAPVPTSTATATTGTATITAATAIAQLDTSTINTGNPGNPGNTGRETNQGIDDALASTDPGSTTGRGAQEPKTTVPRPTTLSDS